jgi:hypothetical protein
MKPTNVVTLQYSAHAYQLIQYAYFVRPSQVLETKDRSRSLYLVLSTNNTKRECYASESKHLSVKFPADSFYHRCACTR